MTAIESGQQWRNKKTGVVTTVLQTPRTDIVNERVVHKGQRTAHTLLHDFVRKYEHLDQQETP